MALNSHRLIPVLARSQAGFSLIELMVALTVGLVLVGATMVIFINSNQARQNVDQFGQQVDNGAYAIQVLSTDLSLAGYAAELDMVNAKCGSGAGCLQPSTTAATPSLPNPCDTTLANFASYLTVPIQGYDMYSSSTLNGCVSDIRTNTDIVVVRRVASCVNTGTTGDCQAQTGAPYFQASLCQSELNTGSISDWYRLDTNLTNLNRHQRDCATLANMRRFITNIYYIANNDKTGDGIPTLKRVQLGGSGGAPAFSTVPIAEGVENMQIDYGIDTVGSGYPSTFMASPAMANWTQIVAVKIHLLVRNTTAVKNYQDTKTYTLGLKADGTANVIPAAKDGYRRHVFGAETRVFNPASQAQGSS